MKTQNKKRILSFLLSTTIFNTSSQIALIYSPKYNKIKEHYNLETSQTIPTNDLEVITKYRNNKIFLNYSNFFSYISAMSTKVPFPKFLVPQGITLVDDKVLITFYDKTLTDNSCIYVIDKDNEITNICTLDNKSHVGGIVYDEKNKLFWIPSTNGFINAYNKHDILNSSKISKPFLSFNVGEQLPNYLDSHKNSISYLTIYKNDLYVGNFSTNNYGLVKKYSITKNLDSSLNLKPETTFKVPTYVQGITFYEMNNQEYMILSRSHGSEVSSILQIYLYKENIKDYEKNKSYTFLEAPAMMEQITIDNENLYILFESGAECYKQSIDTMENICQLDIQHMILKFAKAKK